MRRCDRRRLQWRQSIAAKRRTSGPTAVLTNSIHRRVVVNERSPHDNGFMSEHIDDHPSLLSQSDWDQAEADGRLSAEDVLVRLERIALHEFGQNQAEWPIAFDEDGWVTALTAEGLQMEGGVNLFICTRDHPPPHVHIKRRGGKDIKMNLETGLVEGKLSQGVRPKQLAKFGALVEQKHPVLAERWAQYHGTEVIRCDEEDQPT